MNYQYHLKDMYILHLKDKEYHKWCYTNEFDNLDEMDKFLKIYKLEKLVQWEINNLNNALSIKEIG